MNEEDSSKNDIIEYLRNQLEKERNIRFEIEKKYKLLLEESISASEQLSIECSRAIRETERLLSKKSIGDAVNDDKNVLNPKNYDIEQMKTIQKENKLLRRKSNQIERENDEMRKKLLKVLENQLIDGRKYPKYASSLISISRSLDTTNVFTICDAIEKCCNLYKEIPP